MPLYVYGILAAGYVLWLTPFLLVQRKAQPTKQLDKRARWGILLVFIAFALLWQAHFWERSPQTWQLALSIVLFLLAALLSWTGARALGRQWRLDAGLSADHELITFGPYRFVRHPIYTSMLCVLFGTGFLITPWWLLLPAFLILIAGTEIRVRIEDNLLASQFGEGFVEYKRRVPAYIPFLK
jgi:protein-S-isoprenylcysteine O-methyltransferase Ste14